MKEKVASVGHAAVISALSLKGKWHVSKWWLNLEDIDGILQIPTMKREKKG
jgi:hypothetical protein